MRILRLRNGVLIVCEHTNGFKTGAGDLTLDIEVEYLNLSGIKILPSDSDRLGCCGVAWCPHCPLSTVCVQISPGHKMCDTLLGQQGLDWAGLGCGLAGGDKLADDK